MDIPDTRKPFQALSAGDENAFDRLFPQVYTELKEVAHRRLLQQGWGSTINTTVLVHEAYVKLVDGKGLALSDRSHFLAVASRAMRFILVDYARSNAAQKRGGDLRRVSLDMAQLSKGEEASIDLIVLNDALERLGEFDPRLSRVVECRFFGGMGYDEIAEATDLSVPTVKRDWARARAWLYEFMTEGEPES